MHSAFKTKLHKSLTSFCHKNPLVLLPEITESMVRLRIPEHNKQFDTLFDEIVTEQAADVNTAIHHFINAVDNVLEPLYPRITYRRFHTRQKTPDEMSVSLMKGDESVLVQEENLELRRTFTVTRVDLKRSLFELRDGSEATLFRFEPAAPFLIRLRKLDADPLELGHSFFARAQKVKQLR